MLTARRITRPNLPSFLLSGSVGKEQQVASSGGGNHSQAFIVCHNLTVRGRGDLRLQLVHTDLWERERSGGKYVKHSAQAVRYNNAHTPHMHHLYHEPPRKDSKRFHL